MEMKDYAVDISSPAHPVAHEKQTSSALTVACSSRTSTDYTATPSTSETSGNLESYLKGVIITFIMLLVAFSFLIVAPLAMLFTSIIIPVIIICLILEYWMTCLYHFARCNDYADVDDSYDTVLGIYWHHLVVWMAQLTGILIVELLVCLAIWRFPLKKFSFLHLHAWKWFLIGIIFLVYFFLWCLMRILLHQVREKSSGKRVFLRVHVLPIYEALLGITLSVFYFLVEFLVFKLVPPLRRPKILGLYAHRWVDAVVYVFIGVNVSRLISASLVALLHKHHLKKDDKKEGFSSRFRIPNVMRMAWASVKTFLFTKSNEGCRIVMKTLFRNFDTRKYVVYIVVGLRRSINFVLVSSWLLVTWSSHFEHQIKPSKDSVWVLRVGTSTLTCLLILAVLWLAKNITILWWKYHSIFSRFYDKASEAGIKLYLLGMICGQYFDVLRVGWSANEEKDNGEDEKKKSVKMEVERKEDMKKNADRIDRVIAKARKILVEDPNIAGRQQEERHMNTKDDKTSTCQLDLYAIMRMVKYFLLAEDLFTKDLNALHMLFKKWHEAHPYDQISPRTQLSEKHIKGTYGTKLIDDDDFDAQIKRNKTSDDFTIPHSQIKVENPGQPVINLQDFKNSRAPLNKNHIKHVYRRKLSEDDFGILVRQIKEEFPCGGEEVPLQDFEKWMERTYQSCFNRVSTLANAQRLAEYLDRVMTAVIILTSFGIWLAMVTRNTQTVALVAAPLIALSFMIGDTCSTIFKGIIFSYVIHPYDIDDLCVIRNTLYEAKQIDFWRTSFLNVETNEVVFFPNAALFEESIINKTNKKGSLDTVDRVQFSLERDTDEQNIECLTEKIDSFFEKDSELQKQQTTEVEYNIAKPINVTVHFKHNLKYSKGRSNSEYLQEMKKHKQKLLRHIMKSCKEFNIKAV